LKNNDNLNTIRLNLDKRRLIIGGEISEESTTDILEYFLELQDSSSDEINILFSASVGGDWACGLSLMDTFLNSRNHITTYSVGPNCSTSALLFLCGDERYMSARSSLLFHYGAIELADNYQNIVDYADLMKKEMAQDIEFLVSRSNRPSKYWIEAMDKKDFYVSAEKALELQIIDGIKTIE